MVHRGSGALDGWSVRRSSQNGGADAIPIMSPAMGFEGLNPIWSCAICKDGLSISRNHRLAERSSMLSSWVSQ
jgi:hypothetical protein